MFVLGVIQVVCNFEMLIGLFSMYSWPEILKALSAIESSCQGLSDSNNSDSTLQSLHTPPPPHTITMAPIDMLIGYLDEELRVLKVVKATIMMSMTELLYCPTALPPLIVGRLLPFAAGSPKIHDFIRKCYEKGTGIYKHLLKSAISTGDP